MLMRVVAHPQAVATQRPGCELTVIRGAIHCHVNELKKPASCSLLTSLSLGAAGGVPQRRGFRLRYHGFFGGGAGVDARVAMVVTDASLLVFCSRRRFESSSSSSSSPSSESLVSFILSSPFSFRSSASWSGSVRRSRVVGWIAAATASSALGSPWRGTPIFEGL